MLLVEILDPFYGMRGRSVLLQCDAIGPHAVFDTGENFFTQQTQINMLVYFKPLFNKGYGFFLRPHDVTPAQTMTEAYFWRWKAIRRSSGMSFTFLAQLDSKNSLIRAENRWLRRNTQYKTARTIYLLSQLVYIATFLSVQPL